MSVWFEDFLMWTIKPLKIADEHGKPTGRWRMTATSDEDGGGPFGDTSHDHATASDAMACDECDKFCSQVAGSPTRDQVAQMLTKKESATLEAALVLLRRGEIALASRILAGPDEALAKDIRAFIEAHSSNDQAQPPRAESP